MILPIIASAEPDTVPEPLFQAAASTFSAPSAQPGAKRERSAPLNAAALARLGLPQTARLPLNLFPDATHTFVVDRRTILGEGRVICSGHIEGEPDSHVVITSEAGVVAGVVSIHGYGQWQISHEEGGWHRIREMDPARRHTCGGTVGVAAQTDALAGKIAPTSLGSTNLISVIDVMVVYTTDARIGAGGTNGMHALIDAAVEDANRAYERSRVNLQIRLVHRSEVAYTEAGNLGTDLNRLQSSVDGIMDDIHTLRNTYGADLVCLFTSASAGGASGIANQLSNPAGAAGFGFSVVAAPEALIGTFAHELGHNMGCQHDRYYATSVGAYSYSYGYALTVGGFAYGTIMSYDGSYIPYFSNPNVLYRGVPTGVASGSESADNARTINNLASVISAYRNAAVSTRSPIATITNLVNQQRFPVPGTNITITASASDPDGTVARVDFYKGNTLLGSDASSPYSLVWSNVAEGSYAFTARAVDNLGVAGDSAPVYVIVGSTAPTNDNFANRQALTGSAGSVTGTTFNATKEPGEPSHPDYAGGKSIWYSWTAPLAGTVTFNGYGKAVTAYAGASLGTLTNRDFANIDFTRASFGVVSGAVYQVSVDELSGESAGGETLLSWSLRTLPANDHFSNRVAIVDPVTIVVGHNYGATKEIGEPNHAYPGTATVWWKWTAPRSTNTTISATGVGLFYPLLGVYTGNAVNALTNIGSGGGFSTPSVTFNAVSGTTYQIAVAGLGSEVGEFSVSVDQGQPPSNDNFTNAIVITGTNTTVSGSNRRATTEESEPVHTWFTGKSVWWQWTATAKGSATFTTTGSSFNTVLDIYTNPPIASLTRITGNDDADSFTDYTSRVQVPVASNVTYYISVDGGSQYFSGSFVGNDGFIQLSVAFAPPPPAPVASGLVREASGDFRFRFSAPVGQPFAVQWSTDLMYWFDFTTGTVTTNPMPFVDTSALGYDTRFYRVVFP